MSTDPTRLDPPIALTINASIGLPDRRTPEDLRALAHLAALHRFDNSEGPDRKPPDALTAATHRLFMRRRVTVLLTHIADDGTPTFALAPPPVEGV